MNKTVNINLGGIIFHIDEDAFKKLEKYLSNLRRHFGSEQGTDEILSDIEARIAEILQEKLGDVANVVSTNHVDDVMTAMGSPEELFEEEETHTHTSSSEPKQKKKMFRNPDDKILGGVLGGLSAYVGLDPVWLRLTVILITIFSWGGLAFVYAIMWAVVPLAKNTADKLMMQGEPINFESIGQKVKEGTDGIISEDTKKKSKSFIVNTLDAFFEIIGLLFKVAIKSAVVIAVIIGTILIVVLGVACIALIVSAIIAAPIVCKYADFSLIQGVLLGFFGLFTVLVPLIAIGLILVKLLIKRDMKISNILLGGLMLWLLSTVISGLSAISIVKNYSEEGEVKEIVDVYTESDTLYLSSDNLYGDNGIMIFDAKVWNDDTLMIESIRLDVEQSNNNEISLLQRHRSNGSTLKDAQSIASNINYGVDIEDNNLKFKNYFTLEKGQKYKGQRVRMTLNLPVGKTIYLDKNMKEVIYDIDNVSNTYDGQMLGEFWTMTEEGLACLDCSDFAKSDNNDRDDENERVLTELEFENFDKISIKGSFDINVKQKEDYKVYVKDWGNFDEDDITFSYKNNTLNIELKEESYEGNFDSDEMPEITIELPSLVFFKSFGFNDVDIKNFKEENISLEFQGGSNAEIDIDANNFEIEIDGAAKVEIDGSSDNADITLKGAGYIDAYNFETNNMELSAEGASKADIYVKNELDITLKGASAVGYKGNPSIKKNTSGLSFLYEK